MANGKNRLQMRLLAPAAVVAVLALLPLAASWAGQSYYQVVGARIMVFALAAVGLNLILGFGALVSMGHALYVGLGAYTVAVLSHYGVGNGWVHLATALTISVACAALIGAVCLRATGVAFIMITLAFAQMFYFLAIGLRAFGGDEGLPIALRSRFGPLDLSDATTLYYVTFAVLMITLLAMHRMVHARFGVVLRGTKSNERRMRALGFPVRRYKLAAYVLSALICTLAGLLLANLTRFASPSYMAWNVSGELIVMVILGGLGTVIGPVVGAGVWIALEEALTSFSLNLPSDGDAWVREHWLGLFGLLIVWVSLSVRSGLYGSVVRMREGADR
jgi:branched-chain amino acid transport system permease protein